MNYICNYSIIKFLPYPETGEFVNIGIVLFANNGEFRFRIANEHTRIIHFFENLDSRIFIRARDEIEDELDRIAHSFVRRRDDLTLIKNAFMHIIHQRETMVRFSEPGSMTTHNIDDAVELLFERYVNHSASTTKHPEKRLEHDFGVFLNSAGLKHLYKERRLGNAEYHVVFPFVIIADNTIQQAIKPLYLGYREPSQMIEYGDSWISKMARLNRTDNRAKCTLFIVEPPNINSSKLINAYVEVIEALEEFKGSKVISANSTENQILKAVRRGIPKSLLDVPDLNRDHKW